MKKPGAYLFLFVLLFNSCFSPFKNNSHRKPQVIDHTYSLRSPILNKDYFKLVIDSLNNDLHFSLSPTDDIKDFPFPKDKSGATYYQTVLNFTLLYNNKPINAGNLISREKSQTYFGYNKWLGETISFRTDTIDLRDASLLDVTIPMYALNQLKTGTHDVELLCTQTLFCTGADYKRYKIDSLRKDTSIKYYRHYLNAPLVSFKAKFKVAVPQIFKTTLYCYGIELRNDSVYSPSGMDNTLWKSSYPDVYWTIDYPNQFYCSSDYQESTGFYDRKDTFQLFHYSPYDSISFGVWDHDNLSRDDYIAYQKFGLKQFPNNKIARLRFGNIKCFELRMVKGYAVNR